MPHIQHRRQERDESDATYVAYLEGLGLHCWHRLEQKAPKTPDQAIGELVRLKEAGATIAALTDHMTAVTERGKDGKYLAGCCRCDHTDRIKEGPENAPQSAGPCAQTESLGGER